VSIDSADSYVRSVATISERNRRLSRLRDACAKNTRNEYFRENKSWQTINASPVKHVLALIFPARKKYLSGARHQWTDRGFLAST